MDLSDGAAVDARLRIELLGPLAVRRDGVTLSLPASRKLRALLAYLALAPRPVGRSQLCELLWDGPSDPRGELRWCLSRLRTALDEPERPRVVASGDAVALDLDGCFVDAAEVVLASHDGVEALPPERQQALVELFRGDVLEGLELDGCAAFGHWLAAQRRRLRGCHAALLEQLATRLPADAALGYLEKWLQLSPFDRRVHERLLATLAERSRLREGEQHLIATAALFEAEGLDWAPLRDAWRASRAAHEHDVRVTDVPAAVVVGTATDGAASVSPRRASIAVMPFADESATPRGPGGPANALAHDITTRLAKLRCMFVIAQGSAFALHERRIGPEEAGRMLNVDYVLCGAVHTRGASLRVTVELVETRTARIVWSEILNHRLDQAFVVLDEIGDRVVASIASEIETIERNRAILRPPNSLDAWEAHHRGLWHMYRFTREDNERARRFFQDAVRQDPTFARAHAGLSFTHFQDAFLGWSPRPAAIDRAFATAGQSLMADDRDPAAHWAMGRALWLRGSSEQAVTELGHAVALSPNFALGHYALAFVQSQDGDADAAIAMADCSRRLSPFDPLLFAMLGSRAMALVRLGRFDEASTWAVRAASHPNAHTHIFALAAYCLSLAGSFDAARTHAAVVRKAQPQYGVADFLQAFRFAPEAAALFRRAGRNIGMG